MDSRRPKALLSIHDVMPDTLDEVGQLLAICREACHRRITLLVVPGKQWSNSDLRLLRRWCDEGCELAGHGWLHRCRSVNGWKHRIHQRLISRNVAEHLSLSGEEICQLVSRCARWFDEQDFDRPVLYVPPAWAMGAISAKQLLHLPFPMIETLSGIRQVQTLTRTRLPLFGFEADTLFREQFLRVANQLAMATRHLKKPVRIALHPFDHRLRLRASLRRILALDWDAISYRELMRPA
ncbi:polysaccharide deacetylase family protein [Rhodopirellula sp. MGV]|uniref:polysaccharide deacetylase family protein n=1 Tax=Rhodopirellula sp. MGV TaxID=2023130 RepID=UPI000B9697C3|nr:polysaccharide deacetylase family protein [Rhodopirellula sp. MGV]OYP32969.1 hypothetical protein CGZ80_18895 [Rhodopirellula sp. MGV]PNY35374.1 DUF2334 domain-containing protein [Rhodopirellula baltica]